MRNSLASRLPGLPVQPPPIAQLIGFEPVELDSGRATFQLDVDPARHANPMGTVHGGVLCDLADAAMGYAYASSLVDDETFTTVELKINFLRPVWGGRIYAHAQLVSRGRTLGLVDCDIADASGKLVARASSTCMTLHGHQAEGR